MRTQTFRTALVGILCFNACATLLGTLPSNSQESSSKDMSAETKVANDPKFHARLLEIAAEYANYGKIDAHSRLAPTLCQMPPPRTNIPLQLSKSKDLSTHGQKLYYLYARDRVAYVNNPNVAGQVVVKEAWSQLSAQEVKANQEKKHGTGSTKDPVLLSMDSLLGPKSGLFIIYNTASKTPDTDDGWVYGTVTADGKTVTAAGRVKSCMECHISAPYGRLFGLQK